MDPSAYLIEKNRGCLQHVFLEHTCANESHVLRFSELCKLMTKVNVLPELINSSTLQRYVLQVSGKHSVRSSEVTLTYLHFEKLLRIIAHFGFPVAEEKQKLLNLLQFISPFCQRNYGIKLSLRLPKVHSKHTKERLSLQSSTSTLLRHSQQKQSRLSWSESKSTVTSHCVQSEGLRQLAKSAEKTGRYCEDLATETNISYLDILDLREPSIPERELQYIQQKRSALHSRRAVLKLAFELWKWLA